MNKIANPGSVYLMPNLNRPVSLAMNLFLIRFNEKIDQRFIYYLMKFNEDYIKRFANGTATKSITKDAVRALKFKVPNLSYQKQISSLLSSLDAKIELNSRINSELEAMAKTLYDYWFVQFDFPDSNGKPYKTSGGKMVWSEELKREIPEGWEVGTLDSIGNIIGGSTPSKAINNNFCNNKGTPWITPKDLSNNKGKKFITRGEFDVTERGLKEASLKIMPTGTVLLSSRAPIGYLAIARNDVTTNQGFKSFVPKKGFSTEYIYFTIQNHIPVIEANSSGSTFKEVSTSILRTIKTILPSFSILTSFLNLMNPIFKKQDCIELENQELSTLRDWLLPMLMNGQVSVDGVAKEYKIEEEVLGRVAEPIEKYS
jgi:type I restriction enzyme S subunit